MPCAHLIGARLNWVDLSDSCISDCQFSRTEFFGPT
ncbi:MAG: hypothetical protein HPY61_05660 [Methanotrichaceae archaeon]|nr:hypothetical protein [Methanotrichaceae archaeon]